MKLILTILIVTSALLTGCATVPAIAPPLNRIMSQDARAQQLNCIAQWQLSGMATVHTPEQTVNVSVNWALQDPYHYTLRAYGPLGSGALQLTRKGPTVTLIEPNGNTSTADNPELLMQRRLQWFLPLSNLYYWVRGLPAPNAGAIQYTDRFNHVTRLEQQDFTIDYLRFTGVNGVDLPSKIFMVGHGVTVRIIISQWQIEKNCV